MKKVTLFTLALLCMVQSYASEKAGKDQYVVSPIGENWSVSIGAGAEFHPHKKLLDNPALDVPTSFQVDLSVSKWLNPYVGLRVEASYSTFDVTSTSTMNRYIATGETSADGSIFAMHGDAVFDFTAIFGGYNENRFYSVKPYVGMGFASVGESGKRSGEFTPTIGLLNEFRVSKPLSLHMDLSMITPNAGMYGECVGNPRFFTTSVTVGATYYFGKDKARVYKTVSTSDSYRAMTNKNESLSKDLSDLQKANSSLARDKDALQKELEALRAQNAKVPDVVVETQVEIAPVAIFFEIGSSTIAKEDSARLKYVAEILKEQPDVLFVVEGYADSASGGKKLNQTLSQKRADVVCEVLVKKYGVNASQLKAVGKGAVNDLFDDISLNRAVITRSNK